MMIYFDDVKGTDRRDGFCVVNKGDQEEPDLVYQSIHKQELDTSAKYTSFNVEIEEEELQSLQINKTEWFTYLECDF